MRREEFSFSGFERAQAEAQAAIEKAAEKPQSLAEARLETNAEAHGRVVEARKLTGADRPSSFDVSSEELERALDKPGFDATPQSEPSDPAGFTLGSPSQFASDHRVLDRAKRVRPTSQMADRFETAQTVFGISQDKLFGTPEERLRGAEQEAKRLVETRRGEKDREMAQMAFANAVLAPEELRVRREGMSDPALLAKEQERLGNAITQLTHERDTAKAQLEDIEKSMAETREAIQDQSNASRKEQLMRRLQAYVQKRKFVAEGLDILQRGLTKQEEEYRKFLH